MDDTTEHAGSVGHSAPPSSGSVSSDGVERPSSKTSQIYAFLNHSTETVSDNLPPKADDKSLARQRRRRTSPEDQIILELAYAENSKPDKAARLELVKRVALGEKEVQIWFQNRRQSSRRKSRPLLPHEIAQYQQGRLDMTPHGSFADGSVSNFGGALSTPISTTLLVTDHAGSASDIIPENFSSFASGRRSSLESLQNPESADRHPTSGHLASRQSAPDLRNTVASESTVEAPSTTHSDPPPPVRRSASFMRLSMTSEGSAKIVTKDLTSPSPPRPLQPMGPNATASKPVSQFTFSSGPIAVEMPLVTRTSSGRSRDSRAWEFWCDKDSRSELEDKAEKDASGSAADAIGLLRSTSGRQILGSISSKRNSSMLHTSMSGKRTKLGVEKPKLYKSRTSSGRLQQAREGDAKARSKGSLSLKPSVSGYSINVPGNDSDKENWSPDTSKGDNDDPEADPEIAAFMSSGRKGSNVSGEEELDCVQGLLSLSQGNWR